MIATILIATGPLRTSPTPSLINCAHGPAVTDQNQPATGREPEARVTLAKVSTVKLINHGQSPNILHLSHIPNGSATQPDGPELGLQT
jgi:hypothetical protein